MNLKPRLFEKKRLSHRTHHENSNASLEISKNLLSLLPENINRPIVIVCIGTDRSTGDALGPLVGTKLKEKKQSSFHVYGTLDEPIHAVNLEEQLSFIKKKHIDSFIIGIDACLGRLKSVGDITINEGPLKPGAGVKKELPDVGEIHITGIVNVSGFMEYLVLQNTRLSLVMKLANTIADGLSLTEIALQRPKTVPRIKWGLS
jgi:putative sporulation protein YyaC